MDDLATWCSRFPMRSIIIRLYGVHIFLRFFFLCAEILSWPLSSSLELLEELLSLSLLDELLLDELSEATPVLWLRSMLLAILYNSGSLASRTLTHFLDSLGRPRTVLCQTTGKFVRLQKFCVTATVSSMLSTTCHQPPGTNTVSPGFCRISTWNHR